MDANAEVTARVIELLRSLYRHAEGVSNDDIKLLCACCAVDSRTVMTPEPTPDIRYDGNQDLNSPF